MGGLSAINATAVVGHKGWLAGYQTCFDLTKSAVTKNNFGIGYTAQDFVLHTSVVNGTDFGGSVYQKVSPALETGVSLGKALLLQQPHLELELNMFSLMEQLCAPRSTTR